MNAAFLSILSKPVDTDLNTGYIFGALIAVLLLAYLIYTLIKPEKF